MSVTNGLQRQSGWSEVINLASSSRTVGDALALARVIPSLVQMHKQDPVKTEGAVRVMIHSLVKYLNLARKIDGDQISETTRIVISEFYYMTLADLNVAFTKIKAGFYGDFYEGIDGLKICKAIREYEADRMDAAELQSYNQIQERKMAEREGLPMAVEVAEKLKEVIKPKVEQPAKEEQRKWSDFNPQEKILVEQYLGLERTWRKENPDKSKYLFEKEYMSLNEYVRINTPAPQELGPTAGNNQ